jgi:hypothetical protein
MSPRQAHRTPHRAQAQVCVMKSDHSEAIQRLLRRYGLEDVAESDVLRTKAVAILGEPGLSLRERRRRYEAFVNRYRKKVAPPSPAPKKPSVVIPIPPKRWPASIGSPAAARKMEAFILAKGMDLTEFAIQVGTTDKTLRKFRRTGRIKRSIFNDIAKAMNLTRDELLRG